ncbi:MAG: FMN-dependent NADH-azoreductase [Acidimicrobiales bacterium]
MSLFRLDASIQVEGSASRALGDVVERTWRESEADALVVRRQIGLDPLASNAWSLAVSASRTPEHERTPDQRSAVALAHTLVDELIDADAILMTVPLYNFGVSQHLKTWVDLVITDPRMATQPLAGKHAVVAIVRGGAYGAGTPREGWDHSTAWILRILRDVWGLDVVVVEREFTLVGVNPALDSFADLAAEMHRDAEHLATQHAKHLVSAAA